MTDPAESLEPLLFALKTALDRLSTRLRGRQRAAVRLTLTLVLEPAAEVCNVVCEVCVKPALIKTMGDCNIGGCSIVMVSGAGQIAASL